MTVRARTGRHAPHRAPSTRTRVTPRALGLLVVVVGLLVALSYPVRQYVTQRRGVHELEQTVASLQQQNDALHARAHHLHDASTVEHLARECLGMVRPGEIAFVAIPRGGQPAPPNC